MSIKAVVALAFFSFLAYGGVGTMMYFAVPWVWEIVGPYLPRLLPAASTIGELIILALLAIATFVK